MPHEVERVLPLDLVLVKRTADSVVWGVVTNEGVTSFCPWHFGRLSASYRMCTRLPMYYLGSLLWRWFCISLLMFMA